MAGTPFVAAKTAVVAANGTAQVEMGPPGQDWLITTTTVSASTSVLKSQVSIYVGGTSSANMVEGSFSGSTGDTSDTKYLLQPGTLLYALWSGADPGATVTLRLSGRSFPPGEAAKEPL